MKRHCLVGDWTTVDSVTFWLGRRHWREVFLCERRIRVKLFLMCFFILLLLYKIPFDVLFQFPLHPPHFCSFFLFYFSFKLISLFIKLQLNAFGLCSYREEINMFGLFTFYSTHWKSNPTHSPVIFYCYLNLNAFKMSKLDRIPDPVLGDG